MKSSRQLSKIFTIILHALSVLFAYFLLQGGSLIIQNLPRVDGEQVWQDYLDQAQLEQLNREHEQLQASIEPFKDQLKLNRVESQGLSDVFSLDQKTYQEILASRYVSEDAGVNQKIEALRAKLEAQREGLKNLKQQRSQLELELNKLQQQQLSKGEAISDLKRQAREAFNEQRQGRNLKAFVLRLCFVLPLLLVAWYLLKNYRQTDYWPLVHGWSYFAGFAFFVELVPYLPSYGGYVRSLVGIVICIALGRVLTKKLRDYLQKRREIEQKDELERRNSLQKSDTNMETTLDKINKGICPSCDRRLINPDSKYCSYCGLCIKRPCPSCSLVQISFNKFCYECGCEQQEQQAQQGGHGASV